MKGRIRLGGILLLVVLGAVACGPRSPSGGRQQAGPGASAGSVPVFEKEWTITFPSSAIKAGSYTFVVKNDGAVEHNFVIEAIGLQIDAVQPGQTKQAAVTLEAGTYEVLCNIAGHKEAGMKTTLTVSQ